MYKSITHIIFSKLIITLLIHHDNWLYVLNENGEISMNVKLQAYFFVNKYQHFLFHFIHKVSKKFSILKFCSSLYFKELTWLKKLN